MNLTEASGIVKRLTVRPARRTLPDDVVLVETDAAGITPTVRDVVPAGAPVPRESIWRRLLGNEPTLLAYAVSQDRNLRHEFHVSCTTGDGVETVSLHILLSLGVANPQTVVEKIGTDPVRRLEREVTSIVQRSLGDLLSEDLRGRRMDLEHHIVYGTTISDMSGADHLALLRGFARDLGLCLNQVRVLWRVVGSGVPEQKIKERIDEQRIEHQVKMQALDYEHQESVRRDSLELEREETRRSLEAARLERRYVSAQAERMHELLGKAVDALGVGMDNAAKSIGDPAALRRSVVEILNLQVQVRALAAGRKTEHGPDAPGSPPIRLMSSDDSLDRRLQIVMADVFALADEASIEEVHRMRLLVPALHVIVECARGDKNDSKQLTRWVDELQEEYGRVLDLGGLASDEQRRRLQALLDLTAIRERLRVG